MKHSLSETESARSVDSLRAEVRELREAVAGLEARLSDLDETEAEAEPEDPWAIWPYCWFIAAGNFARNRFHSFQLDRNRRALERHNDRMRQLAESDHGVLHLIQ